MKSGDMDPNSVSINYLRTLGKLSKMMRMECLLQPLIDT